MPGTVVLCEAPLGPEYLTHGTNAHWCRHSLVHYESAVLHNAR
jgi:hypothetical protein